MTARIPTPRIVVGDADVLERRARELAARESGEAPSGLLLRLVAFRLRGRACAVDAGIVERAVVLSAPFAVPLADGSERAVAFVEERPVPVADLAGAAGGIARRASDLAGSPALVLGTPDGPVAVAVEGPIELAEDRIAGTARAEGAEGDVRLAGVLAGGAALLDAPWLGAWAERTVRS